MTSSQKYGIAIGAGAVILTAVILVPELSERSREKRVEKLFRERRAALARRYARA